MGRDEMLDKRDEMKEISRGMGRCVSERRNGNLHWRPLSRI